MCACIYMRGYASDKSLLSSVRCVLLHTYLNRGRQKHDRRKGLVSEIPGAAGLRAGRTEEETPELPRLQGQYCAVLLTLLTPRRHRGFGKIPCCLMVTKRPSNMLVYLGDASAQTSVRAATLR